jgi:hypothetical protein
MNTPRAIALASLLVACGDPGAPELLVPDAVSVQWSDAYDGADDGLGSVVPVDVMVYDSASGEPLAGVALTVSSEHDGTWVLPDGALVPEENGSGPVLFDARHDRYLALQLDEADALVGSRQVVTNADGIARVLLFVDSLPGGPRDFDDVAVVISAASPEDPLEGTVLLQPR